MDWNIIVKENLQVYESIKPKDQGYTVLSSLNDYATGQLLCLATGTQASLKTYRDDIEDCHAESLLKRAYKRFLVDRMKGLIAPLESVSTLEGLVAKERARELVLFVSKFPCGLINRYAGPGIIDPKTGLSLKRKPGRGTECDRGILFVERDPCLDKIKKWLRLGLQGKKLGYLLQLNCKIRLIIIGDCESQPDFDYASHMDLLKMALDCEGHTEVKVLHGVRRPEFIFVPERQPKSVALASWLCSDERVSRNGLKVELIVDGRKQGMTKKLSAQISKLLISNSQMSFDLDSIEKEYRRLQGDKLFQKS